jgi:hypothetical protein
MANSKSRIEDEFDSFLSESDNQLHDDFDSFLSEGSTTAPGAGMGDVKMADASSYTPPTPPPSGSTVYGMDAKPIQASGVSVPLNFLGNAAQSLSTGPINAAVQGIQDKGFTGAGALEVLKNEGKNLANPFTPGPNPIQSSATSLERAGVPNTPQTVYGMDAKPIDNVAGQADIYGGAADLVTPVYGAGLAVDAVKLGAKGVGEAGKAVGAGLEKVGASQMNRIIKPSIPVERKGFDVKDYFKHGLDANGGSPAKGAVKAKELIEKKSNELGQLIKQGKDNGARVNIPELVDAYVQQVKSTEGENPDYWEVIDDLDKQAEKIKNRAKTISPDGTLNLLQAQKFKQNLGKRGQWRQKAEARGLPLSSKQNVESIVSERVYGNLNDAITKAAPEGVRQVNQDLSELIPMRQALEHRAIVAGRNNSLSLGDLGAWIATVANPKLWPIVVANYASKSGTVAAKIYRLGERLQGAKTGAEQLRYVNALKKLGITEDAIKNATQSIAKAKNVIEFPTQDKKIRRENAL